MRRMFVIAILSLLGGCTGASAGDGGLDASRMCGNTTCPAGQYCIPYCSGICACDPAPTEGGVCPFGPCSCGRPGECAPNTAPSCQPTIPSFCHQLSDGTIMCQCA
jgi:hypothetical protein